ncbi:WD40 repeat domain-containing protein [Streptomyces sp. B1-3]|uniref:WD40 repeat domain-containing protein n=1 Tax=Streptomyces sp. B1-3 TaxID=3141453 RepID=UPI003D2AFB30
MRELAVQEIAHISTGFGHSVGCLLAGAGDGRALVFVSVPDGSEFQCWDVRTGELVWRDGEGVSDCNDTVLVRNPGGGLSLAAATEDGVEWWDALTGRYHPERASEEGTVWALSAGQLGGGPVLFGAGNDGTVYRWDGNSGAALEEPRFGVGSGSSAMAVGVVPLPSGESVIVAGDDAGRLWRWDSVTGNPLEEPTVGHDSKVRIIRALPLLATGKALFVSSDQEGVLRRWDAQTGELVGPPMETGTSVFTLATARVDGTDLLLAAGADETVRAWDVETGEGIGLAVQGVAVSGLTQRDGATLLATGTARGEILVYECSVSTE